jgi:hypothetical protein
MISLAVLGYDLRLRKSILFAQSMGYRIHPNDPASSLAADNSANITTSVTAITTKSQKCSATVFQA